MAKLTIKDENGVERIHELVDDLTTVGRASSNTIQITDDKSSRQHCRFERDKEKGFFRVVDLGSTNGLRVNGKKEANVLLRPGDAVSIGRTSMTYDGPGPEPEPDLKLQPVVGEAPAEKTASESKEDGPKYVIEVREGTQKGKVFTLADYGNQAITLGRHSSNVIGVDDEAASNYHAEITREPIGYVISDLSSTNGTRAKGPDQADFERIVKTPLVPGMQIRIGKTIFEYRNVGKPAEDDRVLGTVVLDQDRLEDHLKEKKPETPRTALFVALLLALFAGVVYGVVYLAGGFETVAQKNGDKKDAPPPAATALTNPSFDGAVEDTGGAPKGWRILKSDPKVTVGVDTQQDCRQDAPAKAAVVIRKSQDSAPGAMTCLETQDDLQASPGIIYSVGAAMKNEGDGVFGLRVVWMKGIRQHTSLVFAKSGYHTNWDARSVDVRPPPWAERARVQLFSCGKDGKTYFDDVVYSVKGPAQGEPKEMRTLYEGVKVSFEDAGGAFRINSGGQDVAEEGTLVFAAPDGQSKCDLTMAKADAPEVTAEKISLKGQLFDFAMQDWATYAIESSGGAAGVALKLTAQKSVTGTASKPSLTFCVVAPASQGDLEVTMESGTDRIPATQAKQAQGVRELLFNAGRTPQLCVSFKAPVSVSVQPKGNRRIVTIPMGEDLDVEFSQISIAQKHQADAALAALTSARTAARWPDAYKAFQKIEGQFGQRFPDMLNQARQQMAEIDGKGKAAEKDCAELVGQAAQLKTEAAVNIARQAIEGARKDWCGTPWQPKLDKLAVDLDAALKNMAQIETEKEAQELLAKAQGFLKPDQEVWNVAQAFLKKLVDEKKFAGTKAQQQAKELLLKVDAKIAEESEIDAATKRIRAKIKNYEAAQDWQGAVRSIQKDADYQKYGAKLTEIERLLQEFKRKAGQQP